MTTARGFVVLRELRRVKTVPALQHPAKKKTTGRLPFGCLVEKGERGARQHGKERGPVLAICWVYYVQSEAEQ